MKFNDTGNTHNSLIHYVLFLLGGITTTDYPLADMARATNTAKYDLALKVYRKQDGWDFQDKGTTTFPIATTTLVNGQADYSLPADLLEIRRVEVKDSNGDWHRVYEVDEKNIREALDEYFETDAIPERYRVEAGSLILYPAPDTSLLTASAGLKVTYNPTINEFSSATTTTEIGFGGSGDQAVAHRVAGEWSAIYRPDRLQYLISKADSLEEGYLEHVANKMNDLPDRLSVRYDNNE